MNYKVGQKVRVRKDLILVTYNGVCAVSGMLQYKGKILTIESIVCNSYYVLKGLPYAWNDEMLEPVDIIKYKGKKYDVRASRKDFNNSVIFICEEIQNKKEEILDEVEKRYLRAVIKPFRDRVESIVKMNVSGYFLRFYLKNEEIDFPYFKDKRMYKGMILNEAYTLEQLGLK